MDDQNQYRNKKNGEKKSMVSIKKILTGYCKLFIPKIFDGALQIKNTKEQDKQGLSDQKTSFLNIQLIFVVLLYEGIYKNLFGY